jgi:hypothetical protein
MSHVQQIKATVRQHDLLAGAAPFSHAIAQGLARNNFGIAIVHADIVVEY